MIAWNSVAAMLLRALVMIWVGYGLGKWAEWRSDRPGPARKALVFGKWFFTAWGWLIVLLALTVFRPGT